MKKLYITVILIISIFSLASCSKNSELYIAFNNVSTKDVLYIDDAVRETTFIHNIDLEDSELFVDYNWTAILRQNDELKVLFEEHDFYDYIKIDCSNLITDILENSERYEDTSIYKLVHYEFDSTITLKYKDGFTSLEKTFDVHFYNLTEQYKEDYPPLTSRLQFIEEDYVYIYEVFADGYYMIHSNIGDHVQEYTAHVSDRNFKDNYVSIAVEEKYLGYDFSVYENDILRYKIHMSNDSVYRQIREQDYAFDYSEIEEIWDSFNISNGFVRVGVLSNDKLTIKVESVTKSDESLQNVVEILLEEELLLNNPKEYIISEECYLTYTLVQNNVLEIKMNTIGSNLYGGSVDSVEFIKRIVIN